VRDNLLPYKMFVVKEGHERAFYKRGVFGATDLGVADEQILLEVAMIRRLSKVA
jgi:hypothetical protein